MALALFPDIRSRLAPWLGTMNAVAVAGLPAMPTGEAPVGTELTYQVPKTAAGATFVSDAQAAATSAIQTTGIDIVAVPLPKTQSVLQEFLTFAKGAVGVYGSQGGSLIAPALSTQAPVQPTLITRSSPMGLFDDIWGGIQSGVQGIFPTNQGIDWGSIVNTGVGLATRALAPPAPSAPSSGFAPMTMAATPMIARGVAVVGRGFFTRFPALATAIQGMRNAGMNVTRAKLYGVLKRFGPEFLVTGGLLTAAAVNELAVAGPGYRRMNPANVRALRRSVRRIESFHRLCKTTDTLRRKRR